MSLFPELEQTGEVYIFDDSNTTKISSLPASPDFTIKINVIRLNAEDSLIQGEQLGEYRANIKGTRASEVIEGAVIKIQGTSEKYQVVNKPKYLKLFNRYKLNLKPV